MCILVALALGVAVCAAVSHNTKYRINCLDTDHSGPNTSMRILPDFGNIVTILYWAHRAIQLGFLDPSP